MSTPASHPTARALAQKLKPLCAALLAATACGAVQAQQLMAPTAMVGGYGQRFILAQFSQWYLSIPAAVNPLLDQPGADTSLGNMGKYFVRVHPLCAAKP